MPDNDNVRIQITVVFGAKLRWYPEQVWCSIRIQIEIVSGDRRTHVCVMAFFNSFVPIAERQEDEEMEQETTTEEKVRKRRKNTQEKSHFYFLKVISLINEAQLVSSNDKKLDCLNQVMK